MQQATLFLDQIVQTELDLSLGVRLRHACTGCFKYHKHGKLVSFVIDPSKGCLPLLSRNLANSYCLQVAGNSLTGTLMPNMDKLNLQVSTANIRAGLCCGLALAVQT